MHSCWCVSKSNFPALISIRSCSSTFPASLERWQLCKWPIMSSLHFSNLRTANGGPRKSQHLDLSISDNEHFASIANLSITSMMCYSRGDWELETPVVNTKWTWHSSNFPCIPRSPFTAAHTCISAENCRKECFYKSFRGLYMIKPAWRKTMVSNRNNTEIRYSHGGKYNAPRTQTYGRKKKQAIFILPRF